MRADNTAHRIAAASRRRELARSKAIRAVRELDAAGATVTFESVARAARGVPVLALHPARHPRRGAAAARPRPPGARDAGAGPSPQQRRILLRRLEATTARNQKLAQDNQRLRRQLALASDSSAPPRRLVNVVIRNVRQPQTAPCH